MKKSHPVLIFFIVLFSILVVGYGAMVVISMYTFVPGTIINNTDVAFKTLAEASDMLKAEDYTLHVKLRNGAFDIKGSDIGFNADISSALDVIKTSQNPFLWFMFYDIDAEIAEYNITYDEDLLRKYLLSQKYFQEEYMDAPSDAYIDIVDNEAIVVDGDKGNTIDMDKFLLAIKPYILDRQKNFTADKSGVYIEPNELSDSPRLQTAAKNINEYLTLDISIKYTDDYSYVITPSEIKSMLDIYDDNSVHISRSGIAKFAEKFTRLHNTYGEMHTINTIKNETVILKSVNYGWELEPEVLEQELTDVLSNKESRVIEPEFKHSGYYYDGSDDIGNSYVEISLRDQHVYVIKQGKIVIEMDCVSGNMAAGHGTPSGLFKINNKIRNITLIGPDYESKVAVWMSFNGEIGLHDATWRSYFGGEIYRTNGSHGCVNLPYGLALELFDLVDVNMPVVAYWGSDVKK